MKKSERSKEKSTQILRSDQDRTYYLLEAIYYKLCEIEEK